MKVLLTIFCVAAMLFGGGCGFLLLNGGGPLVLAPLAILALNGVILYGLWGTQTTWRPAYYILGVIDLLIGGVGMFTMLVAGIRLNGSDAVMLLLPIAFLAKGILTFAYARKV